METRLQPVAVQGFFEIPDRHHPGAFAMKRAVVMGLVALALVGCMPLGLGGTGVPDGMAPDPSYKPGVGDRSVLYGFSGGAPMESLPLLKDMTSYDNYERLNQAKEPQEISDLEQRGNLSWASPGTRVIIISLHDRSHAGSRVAAEVRPIDGPWKDRNAWVPVEYVTRLKAITPEP
jgi:hypothetical protein